MPAEFNWISELNIGTWVQSNQTLIITLILVICVLYIAIHEMGGIAEIWKRI